MMKKIIKQLLHSMVYSTLLIGSLAASSTLSYAQSPQSDPGMSNYQPVVGYSDNVAVNSQTKKGSGLPGSTPSQSPNRPYNGPSITIPGTGIRAYFDAPVSPPYNAAASYDTYAGQPGGNRSAILQQSVGQGY